MTKKFPWRTKLEWYSLKGDTWEGHCLDVGFFVIDIIKERNQSKWIVWFNALDGDIDKSYKPFKQGFKDLNVAMEEAMFTALHEMSVVTSELHGAAFSHAKASMKRTAGKRKK